MALLILFNNLAHDFSVALLASLLIVLRIAAAPAVQMPEELLRRLYRRLSAISLWCWVVILAGGAVRAWAYRDFEWLPAAGRGQVAMLLVKHAVLGGLVLAGAWMQLKMAKKLGSGDIAAKAGTASNVPTCFGG